MSSTLNPTDRLAPWSFAEFVDASGHEVVARPPVVDGIVGPTIVRAGRELVNFSSINFLNLGQRLGQTRDFAEAAHTYGLTTGGSRMSQGICRPHQALEEAIARQCGKERAISFATGMLANVGFVHAMSHSAKFDVGLEVKNRDTVFVIDRDSHWSIWKALEGLDYGRSVHAFRHNNAAGLARVLGKVRSKKVVVIIESVYSADGSVAPVMELLDECDRHGAISMVDDANGFMIYGPPHRPFAAEYAAIRDRADFVMVSLAKAVGLEGGALAGPAHAIDAFEILSGTSMFTASMQPPTAHVAERTINALANDPSIVDSYLARVDRLRAQMHERGLPAAGDSYVLSVPVGEDAAALAMREWFVEDGYLVPVFAYPAVPRNQAVLRLIPHAGHTEEQIDGFLNVLASYRRRLGL